MAHEWAMKIIEGNMRAADASDLIERAWAYADAMQAEAEKRNNKETCDKNIGLDSSVLKEWQPDWSQSPTGYDWFAIDGFGAWWYRNEPKWIDGEWSGYQDNLKGSETESAELFGYRGDWRDSLRKRPN